MGRYRRGLTARDALDDRIYGPDLGADDYLAKPFKLTELTARMRTVLRRGHYGASVGASFSPLMLDTEGRPASLGGQPLAVTGREWDLLQGLVEAEAVLRSDTAAQIFFRVTDANGNLLGGDVDMLQLEAQANDPYGILHAGANIQAAAPHPTHSEVFFSATHHGLHIRAVRIYRGLEHHGY